MKTNNKGFTLVELLAVIVILAVLLGIAMPAISNVQTSAKQGTAEDEAMTFVEAIRTCVMAEGDNTAAITSCGTNGKALSNYMDAATGTTATVTLSGSDSSSLVITAFSYKSSQGYTVASSGTASKTEGTFTISASGDSLSVVKNAIRSTTWG